MCSKDDSPPLTWIGCCKFFFVSLYGIALSFNLSFAGLEYASATIAGAGFAMILPLVFIISICLRVETLVISERHGIAKVVGTIICVCGSMAFTLYKGPPLYSHSRNDHHENTSKREEWIKGSLLCIAASVLYSLWLTHQAQLLKQYPGKLRFTIVQSGFSCVAASVYAAATQRHLFSWKLGWNIQLLSVAYSGLIVTGMSYWLQAWVIEKKGPIFNAIFGPLTLIIATIFSAIFLKEALHWGSFLGCGLVVGGLYIFLWGSNKEAQIKARKQSGHSTEETYVEGTIT